ncbi:succinate dehydrogenase [Sulfolobus sp. A20]|uniref:succinate dehydrogenase/fumarate reductase iron-sulfur subunit n=1 Tax=Sulfolobaceae TaxID=118883 RepID=UPI0008460CC0|nr:MULTISPECIES: succinate dehydrogenase/fumarate reductase iron-sulfur subunit [unclassified Sulfolobus]AOL17055.1 succinate dehydrogenase [Sulfolobus sp. A20]TRM77528.1 succinate dehydrogenase/fumarate reductase iron-sulfur subunit [Sulfolobus sp. A20-N-F8]TRM79342.1 succinate dehydrogenase/fumarate reductase iron-sulfur subunit [Sulfolobus sp. B5]TRM97613.1 succinate dehydrogenase/fumarate reductase iron-sulfur subunit [Sulfolobus sp. B1]
MSQNLQEQEVVFKVKRFSPEKGDWWSEYKIKVDRFTQFTEALRRIKSEQDSTLSYRASCHMAVCGSCGMKINGEPRLACKTLVLDIVKKYNNNVITIEPMDYFKPIKDLVVDWDEFYDRMFKVKPRLYPSKEVLEEKAEHRLKPEDQKELWKFAQCIWCGLCVSACPAVRIDSEFLGPAAHAKGYRFLADPRDTITDERMKILIDSSWRCTYCYQCFNVCPRDIEPVTAIKKTRSFTKNYSDKSEVAKRGEKHVEAIYDSIKQTGKLLEGMVYLKTYGLIQSLTDLIYMSKTGKLKYALVQEKNVQNINEIKKILGGEKK